MSKIKDKYKRDEAASQFFEENPELFGWDAESTHDRPGNAQWACKEPDEFKLEKAHTIQEALRTYPKGRERVALEMYFDGKDMGEIQVYLKHKLRSSTIKFIWKVKGKVLMHKRAKKRKKLNMKHRKVVAKNTFEFNGASKSVYLIYTPKSKAHIWTDEQYRVLPEDVQDYLDLQLVKEDKFGDISGHFTKETK